MELTKEQWNRLNEITSELYKADKYGNSTDLCRIACEIRDIIGYDYPEKHREGLSYIRD